MDDTQVIQVISVFATRWKHEKHTPGPKADGRLGRLAQSYDLFRDKIPQLLDQEEISLADLEFEPELGFRQRIDNVLSAKLELFVLPSHQVVAALTLFFSSPNLNTDAEPAEQILDLCGYAQVDIKGVDLATYIGQRAHDKGAYSYDPAAPLAAGEPRPPPRRAGAALPPVPAGVALPPLPPERHQIMFVRDFGDHLTPTQDVVNRILYRTDPPYREEVMKVANPAGLNRESGRFAAVTPYVSFVYGHEDYVDYSIFLTAVQAVGTAAQFSEIWYRAYHLIRTFRDEKQAKEVGVQQRQPLEALVDELGNLQLDLSFSVETSADLGLLIPSLRIESFHRELYDVLELPARARTVSRMFERLESSIQSELTAIDIRERNEQDAKRRDWAIAAGLLSSVGVPLGFLVAFFGVNASQVTSKRSMFSMHYFWAYTAAVIIALLPVAVLLALRMAAKMRARRRKEDARQSKGLGGTLARGVLGAGKTAGRAARPPVAGDVVIAPTAGGAASSG
jgi:hypothetical protein